MPTMLNANQTLGAAFHASPVIQTAIKSILAELAQRQQTLTGAKPACGELRESLDSWLCRATDVRGRGPLYPYLGSGLGNGALVELADGSVKWDLINGIGVHMFGHSDLMLVEAMLRASLSDLVMQGNLQYNEDAIEFAEMLRDEAAKHSRLQHCFVTNSGCMANEAALKVCQQKTGGAPRIIAFADCFMGRSTTMSQIGDTAGYRQGVALNVLVDYLPFYDADFGERSMDRAIWQLEQYIHRYPGQHCALVVELVQGEGGFNTAPRDFFVTLFERARAAGIPIWDDEIQTFGRTESMFCFEHLDLGEYIDVATVGKITQACACLYTADFNPKAGLLSGTFSASSSAFATGLAILKRLRSGGFYGANGRNAQLFDAFRQQAESFVRSHPQWFPSLPTATGGESKRFVAGTGGMMRLSPFGGSKEKIGRLLNNLFEDGVIAFSCGHGPYHLRFLPPIGVMQPAQFKSVFEIMERSFARTS
ncbi:MAG: aminotransferase class III-fold pyridoxal phosphate-dependent enzyme [Phycisphaerales bacterium]|nr:aminotransferase class III-fold pyridoxal phosphate-dependent enzyme [Phycisphaerales bacterium]